MWSWLGFEDNVVEERLQSKHQSLNEDADAAKTVEEALECDYERDCTNLYKYIEEENWTAISKFLETGYWPGNFFADAITPADQVRTWVTRFTASNDGRVRWSQLPLHLAIVVEAPYEIIGSLIELYPQAVRCTDDQHMLPLHLAMRHGSSDNIVDLLLAAFPEAVNAKGKNDRTPIDCAIRGPNKIRGRILGTFVERSKAKATKSISNSYSKEVASLRSKLENKETELGDVKSKLAAVDTAKAALQLDLTSKIHELSGTQKELSQEAKAKLSEVEINNLTKDLETQKKISALEKEKLALEMSQKRTKEEEKALIDELEKVYESVAHSASPEELQVLREEIEQVKQSHLNAGANKSKIELEEMKKHIASELEKADDHTRNELKAMQANIEQLSRAKSMDSVDDLTVLKGQVEGLRTELQLKEVGAGLKYDLALLKDTLELELKDSDTKTNEQITAIEKALSSLKMSDLEKKTNIELLDLKTELEALKADVKERRLADKLTEDVVKLRRRVSDLFPSGGKATKQELNMIKSTLGAIKVADLQSKSNEELVSLNKDLCVLKVQLTEIEETTKMRTELSQLKKKLEVELKEARGSNKEVTSPIKAAIHKIQRLDSKSKLELVALKFQLESIQEQSKVNQEMRDLRVEVETVKKELNKHVMSATGKNKEQLSAIKATVDKIDTKKSGNKTSQDVTTLKSHLSNVKKQLADQELAMLLKSELREIRKSFDAGKDGTAKESNKSETSQMKSMHEKLTEKQLDNRSTQELIKLKDETSSLQLAMKEKQAVSHDIKTIKITLDELLLKKEGKTKEDLLAMKKTVDGINLEELDANSDKEWEELKAQISILRKELDKAGIADKTKQDLANLKEALDTAIAESEGSSKSELSKLKSAVDVIDVSKLDSSKHEEWEELKAEIDALKKELKAKQCESLMAAVQDKLKTVRGLDKIEKSRLAGRIRSVDSNFANKTYFQLTETKKELESISSSLANPSAPKERSLRLGSPKALEKGQRRSFLKRIRSRTSQAGSSSAVAAQKNVPSAPKALSGTASVPPKKTVKPETKKSAAKAVAAVAPAKKPSAPKALSGTASVPPKKTAKPETKTSAAKATKAVTAVAPAKKVSEKKSAESKSDSPPTEKKAASSTSEKTTKKEEIAKKIEVTQSGKTKPPLPNNNKVKEKESEKEGAKEVAKKETKKALDAKPVSKPSSTGDSNKVEEKESGKEDTKKETNKTLAVKSVPKPSSTDQPVQKEMQVASNVDLSTAEEKKEDDSGRVLSKSENGEEDDVSRLFVIRRTQSKTVVSPEGEVETVVVD